MTKKSFNEKDELTGCQICPQDGKSETPTGMTPVKLCCSKPLHQKSEDPVNEYISITDLRNFFFDDKWEEYYSKASGIDLDAQIAELKKNYYCNVVQGIGKTLTEAKAAWNHVYFLDYDIKWTAGLNGMKQCLSELRMSLPNHLMIKPSNRFGIHVILQSDSESYNPAEHVYYAVVAQRILMKYSPAFKKDSPEEQIMDPAFFYKFNQRMNLNYYCFLNGERYRTSDIAVFNESPIGYPRKIESFDDYESELSDVEQSAISYYRFRGTKTRKDDIASSVTRYCTPIDTNGKLSIDKSFSIPGVRFSGNDLRWRIVASLYEQLNHDVDMVGECIKRCFVQQTEMLAALTTIHNNQESGLYGYTSYLIDQFVKRRILHKEDTKYSRILGEDEYLSTFIEPIDQYLNAGSVYLESSPNTGKTELAKLLFERKEKCIILLHQKNILDSKFGDKKYGHYIIRTSDARQLRTLPNKIICIWDTFEEICKRFNTSDYTIIIDEVHNFVTAFSFRPVVIDVLNRLTQNHQLWMTGTPMGEEALMPDHIPLRFTKRAKTKYVYKPLCIQANSFNSFKEQMVTLVNGIVRQYDSLKDGNKRGVFIYDNYHHKDWKDEFNSCANYVSLYRDQDDVAEINKTGQSSKKVVSSTCFLGEGTDITNYSEVTVFIPTNQFISELNVRQFIKRFRDASKVTVYLTQFTEKVDIRMSFGDELNKGLHEYLMTVAQHGTPRNERCDDLLHISKLSTKALRQMVNNP